MLQLRFTVCKSDSTPPITQAYEMLEILECNPQLREYVRFDSRVCEFVLEENAPIAELAKVLESAGCSVKFAKLSAILELQGRGKWCRQEGEWRGIPGIRHASLRRMKTERLLLRLEGHNFEAMIGWYAKVAQEATGAEPPYALSKERTRAHLVTMDAASVAEFL